MPGTDCCCCHSKQPSLKARRLSCYVRFRHCSAWNAQRVIIAGRTVKQRASIAECCPHSTISPRRTSAASPSHRFEGEGRDSSLCRTHLAAGDLTHHLWSEQWALSVLQGRHLGVVAAWVSTGFTLLTYLSSLSAKYCFLAISGRHRNS